MTPSLRVKHGMVGRFGHSPAALFCASHRLCPSYVFIAAKLIAPVMVKKDWEAGFDWVVETIKLDHESLASKMEIEKALHYLKTREFGKVQRRERLDMSHCICHISTNRVFVGIRSNDVQSIPLAHRISPLPCDLLRFEFLPRRLLFTP